MAGLNMVLAVPKRSSSFCGASLSDVSSEVGWLSRTQAEMIMERMTAKKDNFFIWYNLGLDKKHEIMIQI